MYTWICITRNRRHTGMASVIHEITQFYLPPKTAYTCLYSLAAEHRRLLTGYLFPVPLSVVCSVDLMVYVVDCENITIHGLHCHDWINLRNSCRIISVLFWFIRLNLVLVVWTAKTWQYICDHNSGKLWCISIITYLETVTNVRL